MEFSHKKLFGGKKFNMLVLHTFAHFKLRYYMGKLVVGSNENVSTQVTTKVNMNDIQFMLQLLDFCDVILALSMLCHSLFLPGHGPK